MSEDDSLPEPPDELPDSLVEPLGALDVSELRVVQSYVEARIDSLKPPFEAEIMADSAGEVIDVEDHGGYALVRLHPPDPHGSGVNSEFVSLYHVRRERQLDSEESLHWAYLGDIEAPNEHRCQTCGHPVDNHARGCPQYEADAGSTEEN